MKPEDVRKLLGGYATGTLTEDEQRALFEAALADQELFDSLMREQPLKDLLRDRAARARLLDALETPGPAAARWLRWWRRPAALALAGGLAAAALIVVSVAVLRRPVEQPQLAARVSAPPAPVPVPQQAPEPQAAAKLAERPRRVFEAPERKEIAKAAPPALPEPAAPPARNIGVVGGVPGGVIGGIISGPPAFPVSAPPPPPPPAAADTARDLYYQSAAASASSFSPRQEAAEQARKVQALSARAGAVRAPAPAAQSAAPNLGVRYQVLLRGETGEFAPIAPITTVRAGDPVRIRFEPNTAGHLYLLERRPAGGWRLIEHAVLRARAAQDLPSAGGLAYPEGGAKELLAVFSRDAIPGIGNANANASAAQIAAVMARPGDLLDSGNTQIDKSVYVVSASPAAGRLAFEITVHVQ